MKHFLFIGGGVAIVTASSSVANAYTPDSDPVRESLYFVSRVQEATVQQGTCRITFRDFKKYKQFTIPFLYFVSKMFLTHININIRIYIRAFF